jgi:ABC-2 type transport system ATP-binding protein
VARAGVETLSLAIETEGLTKVFGRGDKALTAVKGLELKVEKGEVFGFLGPNGAGKTSTIRMLTGIARPTKGTVRILGEEISPDKLLPKHKIGYMPEMPGYYPALKAIDHLLYWADFFRIPRAEARPRALELLEKVGLREHGSRKAKEFSHGMKKRLALAGALLSDPEVLILDEPSGGLDPEGTFFFRRLIEEEKKRGRTIFLSSHLLPEVQLICDRVGVLNRGSLVAVDTVRELERKVSASAPVRVHVNCPPLSADQVKAAMAVPGVLGMEAHPTGVIVVAAAGTPLGFPLNRALLDANVQVDSFYPLIPTLEEVFLKIVEGSAGGGQP